MLLYMSIYGSGLIHEYIRRQPYTCVYMGDALIHVYIWEMLIVEKSAFSHENLLVLDTWCKILNWLSEELHIGAIPCK